MDYITFHTKSSLHVGQRGTAKEYDKYGDSLIRVRYRYSPDGRTRIKTVELVEKVTIIRKRK